MAKLPKWVGQAHERRQELAAKKKREGGLSSGEAKEAREIKERTAKEVRKATGINKKIGIVFKKGFPV